MQRIVDHGISQLSSSKNILILMPWILLLILVLAVYNTRELSEQILKIRIIHKLRDNLVPIISGKYMKMKYSYFENAKTADLISRIGSTPEIIITDIYWSLLFIPNLLITLSGLLILYLSSGW